MKKMIFMSAFASLALSVEFVHPLPMSSRSTDNGGTLSAIDAYQDGVGAMVIQQGRGIDNSAMNSLVFKYGNEAKENALSIGNQVLFSGTSEDKLLAGKLFADGVNCNDGNALSTGETYLNGVCQGGTLPVNGTICDDIDALTYGDKYTNGICSGTYATSCKTIKTALSTSINGTYFIDPDGVGGANGFIAYCDMTTDGGGWTRLFYQNYTNSKDTTAINLLSAGRPYSFTLNQYEEISASKINSTETLIDMNTGTNFKIKFGNTANINNLYNNGTIPATLVSVIPISITISGTNLITNTSILNKDIQFYNSGAIFGEWNIGFDINGLEWWTSNDSVLIGVRFNSNGVLASSSAHYSSILVR